MAKGEPAAARFNKVEAGVATDVDSSDGFGVAADDAQSDGGNGAPGVARGGGVAAESGALSVEDAVVG